MRPMTDFNLSLHYIVGKESNKVTCIIYLKKIIIVVVVYYAEMFL